jgi:hypothetical protein
MNEIEHSAVADLLAERQRVIAELERLSAIDAQVGEAESAVATIDRAIATLDTEERSGAEAWAKGGVGEPPSPRNAERAGLVKRRLELQSDVDSAHNRVGATMPRRTELNAELRRLDHLLFAEKLHAALEEARHLDARAHELAEEMRGPIGRVIALRFALMRRQDGDNRAEQRLIGESIDVLNGFQMPELGANPGSLEGFIAQWTESLR